MGKNFADNKGNATVFLHYKSESAVHQRDRDFSACALNPGDTFTCGGSSTAATGRFSGGLGAADPGSDFTIADAAGTARAFATATDQFNFGPYNYYRRPSTQYGANAFAHLDIHPQVRAYTEIGFHDDQTNAVIAPGGVFLGETVHSIRFENPLLTPSIRAAIDAGQVAPFAASGDTADLLIGRRNVEGGGRDTDIRHTSYRMLFGAKGEVLKNWNYDVFAHAGKVLYQQVVRNFFSNRRIGRALDVVTDPATGQPACRSFVDGTDLNCVPYDLWHIGGVTQAALNYIQVPGLLNGNTSQDVVGATMQADLGSYGIRLPGAKNGVGVLFGLERRREKLQLEADTSNCEPDLSGSGGATCPVKGYLGVGEVFTEVRVPIMEGRPLADLLSVSASYRYSDYTTNKKTDTYGLGAEWAPVRAARLRASYQHAVRHANITELYQPQNGNLFGMNADPCGPTATGGPPTATLAQCLQSGLDPARYGSALLFSPAGQYQFLEGGNETLSPEKADSYTLGLVFAPGRNLTATVDWWQIDITDAIDSAPPDTILLQCLNNNNLCGQVQRDPVTGALWLGTGQIVSTNQNLGGYKTSGIDLALNYLQPLGGLGSFGVHFVGTWVNEWVFEPIKNAGKFDCAGLYGSQCGTPNPEWRHKLRLSWATPVNVDLAATWRHIDAVDIEGTSSNPLLNDPAPAATDRTLGARDYLDLALAWNISKVFTLRTGVNNVFDKDPPIVSSIIADPAIFGNGNTFPQVYDTLGRVFFFNLAMKI
jgi:outer membrane receptor protein involved in Fe transport